jgi:hypothetical protein
MVETQEKAPVKSEVLYGKLVPKLNKAGSREVGSMSIELKSFEGIKFIQLTQHKQAFGDKPAKDQWVTFDPTNKAIIDAILEASSK